MPMVVRVTKAKATWAEEDNDVYCELRYTILKYIVKSHDLSIIYVWINDWGRQDGIKWDIMNNFPNENGYSIIEIGMITMCSL